MEKALIGTSRSSQSSAEPSSGASASESLAESGSSSQRSPARAARGRRVCWGTAHLISLAMFKDVLGHVSPAVS